MELVSTVRRLTPVIVVERIEPVLDFWRKIGLQAVVEVPDATADDTRLAFVILTNTGVEVMYQTIASVTQDLAAAASVKTAFPSTPQRVTLYLEVDDLDTIERQLDGERIVMPRRTTAYGATEIGFVEPAGNVVIFARQSK